MKIINYKMLIRFLRLHNNKSMDELHPFMCHVIKGHEVEI
jgi:hypothetical protein